MSQLSSAAEVLKWIVLGHPKLNKAISGEKKQVLIYLVSPK